MPRPDSSSESGLPDESALFESAVARFEQAWHESGSPDIAKFLPPSGPLRDRLLKELIAIDQEFRRQKNLPNREGKDQQLQALPVQADSAERNLVFGLLALQLDFVTREQLIRGMYSWIANRNRTLADCLVEFGVLAAENRALLQPLVEAHLVRHQGDPEQSLAALSSVSGILEELTKLPGPALIGTLARISACRQEQSEVRNVGAAAGSSLRFRVIRPHAQGGLGKVFVARDQELNRDVALKEIQPRYADDDVARARFLLEAEITGGLEHPGIVPVYGLGAYADGRPFYAMRFIKGDSLKEAIERFHQPDRRLSPSERSLELRQLLGRFIDVCQAVDYAHSRGVLHRDLKPGNIMLGKYGETLVVDWGVAKAQGESQAAMSVSEVTLRPASGSGMLPTQLGAVVGTPAYMSPEQARGELEGLGPATDVFSLGATLYQLLTGRAPYQGVPTSDLMQCVREAKFPSARQIRRDVPNELDAICNKAMALEPSRRYPNCAQLAQDVEAFLADEPAQACPESVWRKAARWLRRHRAVALSGTLALVLVAAISIIATVSISFQKAEVEKQRGIAVELSGKNARLAQDERRRVFQSAKDNGVHLMNEGRYPEALLWFVNALERTPPDGDERTQRLRIQSLLSNSPELAVVCRHDAWIPSLELSPDGSRLATASKDGTARVWNSDTGRPVSPPLRHDGEVFRARFSPDGTLLATAGSQDLQVKVWRISDGALQCSLPQKDRVGELWFPAGDRVVTHTQAGLLRWNLADQTSEILTPAGANVVGATADLQFAVLRTAQNVQLFELATKRALSPDIAVQPGAWSSDFKGYGSWIAVSSRNSITLRNLKSGEQIDWKIEDAASIHRLLFSPDGQWLCVRALDDRVWLRNIATRQTRSFQTPSPMSFWKFSFDGAFLAMACADAHVRIWHVNSGRMLAPPIPQGAFAGDLAFSRDGHRLHTVSFNRVLTWRIGYLEQHARERPAHPPSNFSVGDIAREVARVATRTSTRDVRLFSLEGESQFPSLPHPAEVTDLKLSPDGRVVACRAADNQLHVWNAETAQPLRPPILGIEEKSLFAVGEDGRVLIRLTEDRTKLTTTFVIQPLAGERQEIRLDATGIGGATFLPQDRILTWPKDGYNRVPVQYTPRIWSAVSGRAESPPLAPELYSPPLVINRTKSLIAVNAGLEVGVWAFDGGSPRRVLSTAEALAGPMEFSPDGRRLAILCEDGSLSIRNLETGQSVSIVRRLPGQQAFMTFSKSGNFLVTVAPDEVCTWDTLTGDPVTPPLFGPAVGPTLLNSAENLLVTLEPATEGFHFQTQPFLPATASLSELRRRAEVLAQARINDQGQRIPLSTADLEERLK